MFEHIRSRHPVFGLVLDVMTAWPRWGGTAMNRRTLAAVAAAGFDIVRVESVFLEIIVAAEAVRPPNAAPIVVLAVDFPASVPVYAQLDLPSMNWADRCA